MGFSDEQLEGMLRRVLVPVEPSPRFVTRLRGRLVHVRGPEGPGVGTLVVVGVGLVLVVAAWLGFALRLVLALVGIFGLLGNRRTVQSGVRVAD